ncbi:MAG: hypothetical protein MH472_01575 [Bacteroidia bacterium]|nr:hypothetical protein [Bacteroidia bacterium]
MKNFVLLFFILMGFSCSKDVADVSNDSGEQQNNSTAFKGEKTISYQSIHVDVIIDKPALAVVDVLLVFHGTVMSDTSILSAANNTLDKFKEILTNKNMMLVSVAYPQENILFGDNLPYGETALLWLKNKAGEELGIKINKIFMAGHSQGGYMVTRLNTLHQTDGVIANAPGPLNLVYRCELEEKGQIPSGAVCTRLKNTFGSTSVNPNAYFQRSLLNYTRGFKSDILFVQGLNDSPIQLYSWPTFKKDLTECSNCQNIQFVEVPGGSHGSLFESETAKSEFNNFINNRILK